MEVEYVKGLSPQLSLLDAQEEEVEVLKIGQWSADTIGEFLRTKLVAAAAA